MDGFFDKLFGLKKDKNDLKIDLKDGQEIEMNSWWLNRELEFQHQDKDYQFRQNPENSLKFGEIINSLFDIRKRELAVLTINDGAITTLENEDEIWNYEFLSRYNKDSNGEYSYFTEGCSKLRNQIVLTLAYRTYEKGLNDNDKSISKRDAMLIIHLQYPLGIKNMAMYIQATFCRPTVMLERAKLGVNPKPDYLSILLAIDDKVDHKTVEEFNETFNAAKEKVMNNNSGSLNNTERELISLLLHPNIAEGLFMGKKVMEENRFWDAVVYFEDAFKALQQQYWKNGLQSEEFEMLFEFSYLLGFCYYELGLFEKSFKFLEFAAQKNGKPYKYKSEYTNCLTTLKDIRAYNVIDDYLKMLDEVPENEQTNEEYDFYLYLLRRKAFCLIEFNDFDAAENILSQILEMEPNNAFALGELEFIRKTKGKPNN
jgi:tetratricopeptide (TPR) repeat protein